MEAASRMLRLDIVGDVFLVTQQTVFSKLETLVQHPSAKNHPNK
jgi:hypothetical protein